MEQALQTKESFDFYGLHFDSEGNDEPESEIDMSWRPPWRQPSI